MHGLQTNCTSGNGVGTATGDGAGAGVIGKMPVAKRRCNEIEHQYHDGMCQYHNSHYMNKNNVIITYRNRRLQL